RRRAFLRSAVSSDNSREAVRARRAASCTASRTGSASVVPGLSGASMELVVMRPSLPMRPVPGPAEHRHEKPFVVGERPEVPRRPTLLDGEPRGLGVALDLRPRPAAVEAEAHHQSTRLAVAAL